MNTLYVVMPAYNEEANIEAVIRQWYPVLSMGSEDSRLVIADSGSSDRTHEIIEGLKENGYPQLTAYSDTLKQHGPKVIALYKYAIDNGADFVFQTDSDGQTNPDEFCQFWEMRNAYDAIFGVRTVRGDGKSRKFVENVVCFLLRCYFGVKVKDANAPFRLFNTAVLNKYVGRFDEDYNLPNIMLTTFYTYYHENCSFREITFKPRQGGVNSINIRKIVKIGWKALGDFRRFKKSM
ncbi:MAG: glycosyltransferase family 2 protein [Clostridiales bacterium]|nr:glycosyltransferase family 2 protein [Clostridiales bacterium]